ncbi:MAG: acetyl-coenzyme A synthetase, partial [Myxococcales bacterium]|nr:acetyl-coenzyme A synthetase [Myxococcales bacterium]
MNGDTYDIPARVREGSTSDIRSIDDWRRAYLDCQADPDGFWLDVTRDLVEWRAAPTVGLEGDYRHIKGGPFTWFGDGQLNVTETCLDQHLEERGDKTAILWEGDEPGD